MGRIHSVLEESAIAILTSGREIARYVYRPDTPREESPRPYFHPLTTLEGRVITGFREEDHPWHHGLSLTFTDINGNTFWGGPTFSPEDGYVMQENHGKVLHRAWRPGQRTANRLTLVEELEWQSASGAPLLSEIRRIEFILAASEADCWSLRWQSTLRNISGEDLEFGSPTTNGRPGAGYGGLFWRGNANLTKGFFMGPYGLCESALLGTSSPWIACRCEVDSEPVTVLMMDQATSVRYPTQWFVRNNGYLGASFAITFDKVMVLREDTSCTIYHAMVIADGHRSPDDLLVSWLA